MDKQNQMPDPQHILNVISKQLGEMTPAQVIRSLRSIEEKRPARAGQPSAIVLRNLGPGALQVHGFGIPARTLKKDDELPINSLPVKPLPQAEAVRDLRDDAPFVYVSHALSVTFVCSVKTGANFQIDTRGLGSNRTDSIKLLLEVEAVGGEPELYRIEPARVISFAIGEGVYVRLIGIGVSINIENQVSTGSQQEGA